LCADLVRWESNKSFMYVDTRGFVTTGIGNKLSNSQEAIALSWQHKTTGLPATSAEVGTAFERVRATYVEFRNQNPDPKASASASHYEQATDLVLPPGKATELANARLRDDFLPKLQRIFPGFDRYPLPAQRALVDMIYTLGAKGLETKFPTLVAACRRGDFATAANHCHRKAQANEHRKGDERNETTRNLLIEAASLTASVHGITKEVRL
jgi:GH24 family phage-related lysozyme (muramidase)